MPEKRDFLDGYVEVKDRIKVFYELYGQGRLVTDQVEILTGADGKQRVMVRALAYRSPDDTLPAVGYSWMEIPGTTNYTRGSELENTETSAIGRAIGFLGILVDKSIASANEVRAKADEGEPPEWTERNPRVDALTNGGLIGIAMKTDKMTSDFHVRQTTEGPFIGFRLKDGDKRNGILVEALGELATDLYLIENLVIGQRVQVWGHWVTHRIEKANRDYDAFRIDRIAGPGFALPEPDAVLAPDSGGVASGEPAADNPPAPLTSEQEAEIDAIPLFGTVGEPAA